MNNEEQKPAERRSTQKRQLFLQWFCAGIWLVCAVMDLIFDQKLFLTILHCVCMVCFLLSAIFMTKRYREEKHD